jgi:hypothetical protein
MTIDPAETDSAFKVLHCPDRIVITGTSIDIGHEDAMRSFSKAYGIDEMHVAAWARPLTDRIYAMSAAYGATTPQGIIDCNTYKGRKDDMVKSLRRAARRAQRRFICGFRSMEACRTFYRSLSKAIALKGSPFYLRQNKCLHFYFYFEDPILGLVSLRIQSYAPFGIQFIVNGHEILSRLLTKHGIRHIRHENCLTSVSNIKRAQELADTITGPFLDDNLQRIIGEKVPLADVLPRGYRLTVRQVEYSTDIYLTTPRYAADRYTQLVRQLTLHHPQEFLSYLTNATRRSRDPRCTTRRNHLGTCVKFHSGPLSIKVYHKEPHIIWIETTSYNLTKIRAVRCCVTRNGKTEIKRAQLTRSLKDVQLFWRFARHANGRMLHRLSDIWKRCYTPQHIRRLANRTSTLGTTYRGINLFDDHDGRIITAINDPSHDLTGFKRSDMLSAIPGLTKHQATYALKRLRAHGLIKKEAKSHRYFPTRLGRQSQTACVALHNLIVLPLLAAS